MGKADPLLLTDAIGDDLSRSGRDIAHFAGHIIDFFITAYGHGQRDSGSIVAPRNH